MGLARALTLASLLTAVGSVAVAQQACETGDATCARALFEQALGRIADGRFAEARDLLRVAHRAAPNPASAFNLAVALRGTGESVEAAALLDALVEGEHGPLAPHQRRDVSTLREEIEREVATLALTACGGRGVVVRLDGARWERFDGCRELVRRLNAGPHIVRVTGVDRRPLERRVDIARGERQVLSLDLMTIPTGLLVVRTASPHAEVEVEEVGRGTGGFSRRVPEGRYVVHATVAGAETDTRQVTVTAGRSTEVVFSVGEDTTPFVVLGISLGVAALAAAGVVLGVVLAQDRTAPLITDDVWNVAFTLRGTF